ncbi:SDR family NAD(P)-dependent oxidoreductase [Streptomyces sp. LMG1-1-1.1]|uniref:SDR family NAD(P)-dependent oxidoreductase n=1 Tax=Streptomyces sp. LMG1-1-1.1 TaxID=3135245 RepID=UPI003467EBE5
MDLNGRTVVITGAGRGLGRALALRAGRLGAQVFVAARSVEAAQKVVGEVAEDSGASACAFACDLAEPASIPAFAQEIAGRTDRVDVLVSNGARYLGPRALGCR